MKKPPYHDVQGDFLIVAAITKGRTPQAPDEYQLSSEPLLSIWKTCQYCWKNVSDERWPISKIVKFFSDSMSHFNFF